MRQAVGLQAELLRMPCLRSFQLKWYKVKSPQILLVRTCLCQLLDTGEGEPPLVCFASTEVMD